jgi:integrase
VARQPRPWQRAACGGAWYAQIRGVQTRLAGPDATLAEAYEALYARLAEKPAERPQRQPAALSVRDVLSLFLTHCKAAVSRDELKQVTLEGYVRYLERAKTRLGTIVAAELRPHQVEDWVNAKPPGWGPTSRYNAITAIKAAFNWARKAGHMDSSPIADMDRPRPKRREEILTGKQVATLLKACQGRALHDLIVALRETGCRPGEVCRLEGTGVDLDSRTWEVGNKTEHATGEETRTVYLTDLMVDLSRRLMERWPEGPIFRNERGRPWTRSGYGHEVRKLAAALKMGPEAVAYSLRHLYVTDGLEKGIPPATLAELVGHKDVTMIMRIYNKLKKRTEHLHEAARLIRQEPGEVV